MHFVPPKEPIRMSVTGFDKLAAAVLTVGCYAALIVYIFGWLADDMVAQGLPAYLLWLGAPSLVTSAPRVYRSQLAQMSRREAPICWGNEPCAIQK